MPVCKTPPAGKLPLAAGVRIAAQVEVGPDECRRWMILVGPPRTTAAALKAAERRAIIAGGWELTEGLAPVDVAADSSDGKLFVSFSTGAEEIQADGWGDRGWGEPEIARTLRRVVRAGRPVLALVLQRG